MNKITCCGPLNNCILDVHCKIFLLSSKLQCPNDDNSTLLLSEAITVGRRTE